MISLFDLKLRELAATGGDKLVVSVLGDQMRYGAIFYIDIKAYLNNTKSYLKKQRFL